MSAHLPCRFCKPSADLGEPVHPNYLRHISICLCIFGFISFSQAEVLTSSDLYKLRNVGSVALSPDGHYIAYTITMHDVPGRPYGQLWVIDLNTQKSTRLGGDNPAGGPLWSADSKWIAFHGQDGDKHGLLIAHPDGRGPTFLAEMKGTNSPLPGTGKDIARSPDATPHDVTASTPGARAPQAPPDIT